MAGAPQTACAQAPRWVRAGWALESELWAGSRHRPHPCQEALAGLSRLASRRGPRLASRSAAPAAQTGREPLLVMARRRGTWQRAKPARPSRKSVRVWGLRARLPWTVRLGPAAGLSWGSRVVARAGWSPSPPAPRERRGVAGRPTTAGRREQASPVERAPAGGGRGPGPGPAAEGWRGARGEGGGGGAGGRGRPAGAGGGRAA